MPGSVASGFSGSAFDVAMDEALFGDMDLADADSVRAGNAASGQAATSSRPARVRKLHFGLSKPCVCCLCGSKSDQPSPLADASETDQWGGKRPWGKYRSGVVNRETGEEFSVPEGKVELICLKVFNLLGLRAVHGSYKKYSEKIKSKAVDHDEFLSSLAEYIKQYNADPTSRSRIDLAQKQAVVKAKTTLKTVKDAGVEFEAPDTYFVAEENWNEAEYGKLDESKVEEKKLFGRVIRGAYVQTGKAGHFKVKDFQRQSHREETEEHDGEQLMFNEQGLANKRKAVEAAFNEAQQERRAAAAAAKGPQQMDMSAILAVIQGASQAPDAEAAPLEVAGSVVGQAASGQEAASSESEEEDEQGVAERLAVSKKAAKAKAKLKPAASGQVKARPSAAKPGEPLPASSAAPRNAPASKPSTPAPSKPSAPQQSSEKTPAGTEHAPILMDGRGLRLKANTAKALDDHRRKLGPLLVFDQSYSWGDKKANAGRNKSLSSLKNHVANLKKKLEESSNKRGLADELVEVENLLEALSAAATLNAELVSATPKPDELESALQLLEGNRVRDCPFLTSDSIWLKLLEVRCGELIMFRNMKAYCQLFAKDAKEATLVLVFIHA